MPSAIGKCKLFRIKHTTLLEGETFLKNKHEIEFFEINAHFLVEKKTPSIYTSHKMQYLPPLKSADYLE